MDTLISSTQIFEELESQVQAYSRLFPCVFERAKSEFLYDEQGQEYIDFLSGAGALNYGHNHPVFKQKLLDYINADGITLGLDLHTRAKGEFLSTFNEKILKPRKLDYKIQFTGPTGTNAVEAALKLARKVTGRKTIACFTNAFHGVTLGALAVTANQYYKNSAGVNLTGTRQFPYHGFYGPDCDTTVELEKAFSTSHESDLPAAVIVETVQGEGGINVADQQWLKKLERLCRQYHVLLIVDEVQTGCGRTGKFFSFENTDIKPDIVTLSKSLSGYGLPFAMVLLKPELDQWLPGEHNGTFRGNSLALVTAKAAIDTFWSDDNFEQSIINKAYYLSQRLQMIVDEFDSFNFEVRGKGMLVGFDCKSGELAGRIANEAFQHKLIIETSGAQNQVIKFMCPLTVDISSLKKGIYIFNQAVRSVCGPYA